MSFSLFSKIERQGTTKTMGNFWTHEKKREITVHI